MAIREKSCNKRMAYSTLVVLEALSPAKMGNHIHKMLSARKAFQEALKEQLDFREEKAKTAKEEQNMYDTTKLAPLRNQLQKLFEELAEAEEPTEEQKTKAKAYQDLLNSHKFEYDKILSLKSSEVEAKFEEVGQDIITISFPPEVFNYCARQLKQEGHTTLSNVIGLEDLQLAQEFFEILI